MCLSVPLGNLDTLLQPVCSQRDQPGNQLEVPWRESVSSTGSTSLMISLFSIEIGVADY